MFAQGRELFLHGPGQTVQRIIRAEDGGQGLGYVGVFLAAAHFCDGSRQAGSRAAGGQRDLVADGALVFGGQGQIGGRSDLLAFAVRVFGRDHRGRNGQGLLCIEGGGQFVQDVLGRILRGGGHGHAGVGDGQGDHTRAGGRACQLQLAAGGHARRVRGHGQHGQVQVLVGADGGPHHELGLAAVAEQRARRGVIVDLDGDQRGVAALGLLGDDEHFLAVGGQGTHGIGGIELEVFARLADAGRDLVERDVRAGHLCLLSVRRHNGQVGDPLGGAHQLAAVQAAQIIGRGRDGHGLIVGDVAARGVLAGDAQAGGCFDVEVNAHRGLLIYEC